MSWGDYFEQSSKRRSKCASLFWPAWLPSSWGRPSPALQTPRKRRFKHDGDDKTVVRKEQQLNILPVPHVEDKKTVIKKDRD